MSKRKSTAQPVAPYIGGKRNLAKRLCRLIDAHEHTTYAEPFVGMGGIFLRRSAPAKAEFINDRSRDVYTLFRVLQEHYVAFLDLLRFQITTQANFERLMLVDPDTLTDLQRAARFLYLQRTAYGGRVDRRTFGVSADRSARFNLTTLEPDLEALHERLSGVTVMNTDFKVFLDRIDRKGTLFYLDPPYAGCETDYGKDVFQPSDFVVLAARLKRLKGDFILSINETPGILELFGSWATVEPVSTTYTLGAKASKEVRELVISSLSPGMIRRALETP
ncbi:DNA adenine methylase [Roseobacter sp. S98]|uniref:DNA adenine methylase n=1 Tax=Roseobacter algicola (ex Choi et al. 2025) (nom. illeg.) TaxID=3092138 RepID=UPI003F513DDC